MDVARVAITDAAADVLRHQRAHHVRPPVGPRDAANVQ
jgi:hypothetical protein